MNKCLYWLSFDKTNMCFHFERCLVTDVEWLKSVGFIYRKNRTIARLWIRTRNWLASVVLWYFVCDARKTFIHTTLCMMYDVCKCMLMLCLFIQFSLVCFDYFIHLFFSVHFGHIWFLMILNYCGFVHSFYIQWKMNHEMMNV